MKIKKCGKRKDIGIRVNFPGKNYRKPRFFNHDRELQRLVPEVSTKFLLSFGLFE